MTHHEATLTPSVQCPFVLQNHLKTLVLVNHFPLFSVLFCQPLERLMPSNLQQWIIQPHNPSKAEQLACITSSSLA
jgi:hypothetical protein